MEVHRFSDRRAVLWRVPLHQDILNGFFERVGLLVEVVDMPLRSPGKVLPVVIVAGRGDYGEHRF